MEAKDLMIDDWAACEGKNGKVKELREHKLSLKTENSVMIVYYNNVKPIPITPEILEKNFTYDSFGFFYFFGDTYLDIKEYTDGLWQVKVDEIMSSLPAWRMFVINVHELQHALRLAGIDKEITI
jgi:hypothetical protein